MASLLYRVRENFIYQLEQIVPTYSGISRRFRSVDAVARIDDNESGNARNFWVVRLRRDRDEAPTDASLRLALHHYELLVAYPTAIGHDAIHKCIDMDCHDIIERLRSDGANGESYHTGVDGDPVADTGIWHRYRESEQITVRDGVWILTQLWAVSVMETI